MSDPQHPELHVPERLHAEVERLVWAKGVSESALQEIVATAEYVEVAAGERLVALDTEMTHVYFILRGGVEAVLYDPLGKEVLRQSLTRGDVVGLLSIALPDRSSIEAQVMEPTAALRLTLEQLLQLSSRHTDFQLALLRAAAGIAKRIVTVDRALPKPQVVAIVHQSDATRPLTAMLVRRLLELDEHPCVASDSESQRPGGDVPFRLLAEEGRVIDAEQRGRMLKEWASYGRLLIDVDSSLGSEHLAQVFGFADVVLWCLRSNEVERATELLRSLLSRVPTWRDKVCVVWLLPADAPASPYAPDLLVLAARDFKLSFDAPPSERTGPLLRNGFERIVHFLRGVQIGLALGGGAARGMAHLGVLKALEANGIFVDRVAGTSAGAMTGTVYAAGIEPEYGTGCFKRDLLPNWFFRRLPAGGYWYLLYKYRMNRFEPMLRKYLGDARMEQLLLPAATISVDLVEGIPLVREQGDATVNILESINLPPLALPLVGNGQAVVDGGLLNNVPANVLLAQGCNFVIASTVSSKIEKEFMGIRSRKRLGFSSRMFSTMQVVMRQNMIQGYNMNAVGIQPADLVIAPDVTTFDLSEFTRADEMAAIGENATQASLPQLRSMLAKLDGNLFGK
jgi:predicted acylesterase/phospholipase RssA/CRP-like cAMP-binding protein